MMDYLVIFSNEELETLKFWLSQMGFSGSKAEVKKSVALHDAIENKLTHALTHTQQNEFDYPNNDVVKLAQPNGHP